MEQFAFPWLPLGVRVYVLARIAVFIGVRKCVNVTFSRSFEIDNKLFAISFEKMSDKPIADAIRELKTPAIAGFGNPLLDITVRTLNSGDILKKYSLEIDGEKELTADVIQQLINQLPSELINV